MKHEPLFYEFIRLTVILMTIVLGAIHIFFGPYFLKKYSGIKVIDSLTSIGGEIMIEHELREIASSKDAKDVMVFLWIIKIGKLLILLSFILFIVTLFTYAIG